MDGQGQIVIEGVNHTYRPARGRTVLALSDVSLEVRPREFLALLGPSGCGKSTLLYLVGGFLPTEAGRIAVEGRPVTAPGPPRSLAAEERTARKELQRLERQLDRLSAREAELTGLLAANATDYEKLTALGAELRAVQAEKSDLEDRWLAVAAGLDV